MKDERKPLCNPDKRRQRDDSHEGSIRRGGQLKSWPGSEEDGVEEEKHEVA